MAFIFGRKNANKNDGKPEEEAKKTPAEEETVPAEEPSVPDEPAIPEEPAVPEAADEPAEPKKPEPAPEHPAPEHPAPEPFIPLNGSVSVPHASAPSDKPRFRTPEGFDFNRYFLAERRIALENVSYETQRAASNQLQLNIRDTIVAQLLQGGVKVTYNRTLSFNPDGPFTLSVSFSVMLVFNPGTRGEVDWKTIDVAEEFKKNCPHLVAAMNAKIGLLVAEITNAGGTPIFPPMPRPN